MGGVKNTRSLQPIWMGDEDWRFPRTGDPRHYHPVPELQEGRQDEMMMTDKDWQFPQNLRQHHPVRKLQEERQQEIMMGDKDWRFSRTPATPSGFQATRKETRRDCDGRPGLAISLDTRDPRHYHPVPKLQEGRQGEIMMGDKAWRPGSSGTTICSLEQI